MKTLKTQESSDENRLETILGGWQNEGLERELTDSRYYRLISRVQQLIHREIPDEVIPTNKVAAPLEVRQENFKGINYKRAVMFLQSNGCEWALKGGHGCTMCGHLARQIRKQTTIPTKDYYRQFVSEFNAIDFKMHPLLNLYNNGSFLNDREIPAGARRMILRMIGRQPDIKMVVLETRPEFITREKIKEIKELLGDKYVELAMGLEIKDDFMRAVCVNKGFSRRQYKAAAGIITDTLGLRTYVLLKPPFLTEKESILHAVETIKYAFELGSDTVSLESLTVQDYTLVKFLEDRGLFKPPWLWSIIEVIRATHHLGKLIAGLFQFFPSPIKVPYNCDRCSQAVMETLREYNHTLDIRVFQGLTCPCQTRWGKELAAKLPPFKQRFLPIFKQLQTFARENQGE
jgi:radical SAM enzyme (TIGR01210 family)